jgi:hypothetical protein
MSVTITITLNGNYDQWSSPEKFLAAAEVLKEQLPMLLI